MPRNRGQNSAGKRKPNDSPKSKASESEVKVRDSIPIQESQEHEESQDLSQQIEVGATIESIKVEETGEQCEEKPNNNEAEGQSKKKKNKKNKKQDKEEIDDLVNNIESPRASPQEKLWMKIESLCKECPEPICEFFKKLAFGEHWTYLKKFNVAELRNVLEFCKVKEEQSLQENQHIQQGGKKGKTRGKSDDVSNSKHEEEIKKLKGEVERLKQQLEATNGDCRKLQGDLALNQANKDKIYNQLQVRDEEYHRLKNECQNIYDEGMRLRTQLGREEAKCKRLMESNKELAEDRDQFKDRFSKLAETKLTAGNARIQDLSDMNRPQKLGEKLSELYDNEWTDAFEDLRDSEDLDEKATVQKLLDLFKTCVSFCQLNAEQQELSLMESVRNSVSFCETSNSELCNGSTEESNQDVLSPRDTKMLKDMLKTKAGISVEHLKKVFVAEHPTYAALGENIHAFINGCLEVCWLSAVQDPPLAFDWNFPEGSDVADKSVKLFTKSGTKVDYVVWPVMKLHVDGDVLCKGVVQPIPEEKQPKKSKKDS